MTPLSLISFIITVFGTFVIINIANSRNSGMRKSDVYFVIPLTLVIMVVSSFLNGYAVGVSSMDNDSVAVAPEPERPVLYEAASESILAAPLDPALQEELKDVTGQPEASEPAQAAPVGNASVWDAIASCESNNNWHIATGNGYRGGLQWNQNTWMAVKPDSAPNDPAVASREQEIAAANNLMAQPWGGYQHWPVCSKVIGLR